jgi:CheY-like chemotaxis protein
MWTVLIVEDEKISSMLLEHLVSQLGCSIVGSVSTGAEAIRLAESAKPDLIIMDVGLKGDMDGIEAANIICQRKPVPVLFLTAYAHEEIAKHQQPPEAFDFLPKPVMIDELERKLNEIFNRT